MSNVVTIGAFTASPATVSQLAAARRIAPRLALVCEVLRLYCYLLGYTFKITSGYRTDEEQNRLYAQGRTAPGPVVTNARAGQSRHNGQGRGHSAAVDIYCTDPAHPKRTAADVTSEVAKVGVALGLKWGGNWQGAAAKALGDVWHLEVPTL